MRYLFALLLLISFPAFGQTVYLNSTATGGGGGGVANITATTPLNQTSTSGGTNIFASTPFSVPNGGTGLSALTTGIIYKGNGTGNVAPSAVSDNGTIVSSTESIDVTTNAFVMEIPNGSPGTTVNKLAKINSSGKATVALTTDTSGITGVVVGGAGAGGNAQIATGGTASCAFDGTAASGDYVGISSSVAGDCSDVGSSLPGSGQNLGRVITGGSGAGTYTLALVASPLFITNNSTGASGNVQTSNGSGGFNNFALPITAAQGGTGLTSPGANGNFLQSNGSGWVSAIGTTSTGTGVPAGSLGQLQFNATGGNFGALTTFYVQGYGAVCDGATDNTTPIQTALNAATAAGGGTVVFPPGVCISSTLTLNNFQQWRGAGVNSTVIKLKNGTNADLVIGANYNTWAGTNTAFGVGDWSMVDLSLDGNVSNNTATAVTCGATSATSNGVKVYGYEFFINRVTINNFAGCGWYSQWSTTAGCPFQGTSGSTKVPDCMEADINDLKLAHNHGPAAFDYEGPHDSHQQNVIALENTNTELMWAGAGGSIVYNAHGFGFPNAGAGHVDLDIETGIFCYNCYADGGTTQIGGTGCNADVCLRMENSTLNHLILGKSGWTCGQGPYRMVFEGNQVTDITNYAGCGFLDSWIGGTVDSISATGLGYYEPAFSYGVFGLPSYTGGGSAGGTTPQLVFTNSGGGTASAAFQFASSNLTLNSGAKALGGLPTTQAMLVNQNAQVQIGTGSPVSGTTLGVAGDIDLASNSYLNWGITDGTAGYGFRDSSGTLQFKNSGGAWTSLSNSVSWPASGSVVVSNSTNSPTGIPETNGLCIVGSGGAWGAGSCAGTSSINLGTVVTATSPQRSGDATTGFYTAGAGLVDIAVSGVKMIEWSSVGETLQHALNVLGKITYGGPVNVHTNSVTTGATYNVSSTTDYFVCINKGTGSATTVNLPATPTAGDLYIIKDCKGDAGTNNITVNATGATIDGASSSLINTNYGLQGFIATSASTWAAE